jgi:hypothetical protein
MSDYGDVRLIRELTTLGYSVERVVGQDGGTYVVFQEYEIPVGKFAGRVIGLGLLASADFPNSVHSAIHIKADPQLYETSENIPNIRNVQLSGLGPKWRYWSKNFNWNNENEKTARRLMTKITTIFEHA